VRSIPFDSLLRSLQSPRGKSALLGSYLDGRGIVRIKTKLMNIEQLRKFCLAFPGAAEDIKWENDLCFCVGGKMFCVTGLDSTGGGLSVKCTPEKFAELTERNGIEPAGYVARYHWIYIKDADAVTPAELKSLIGKSYELVFDKLPSKVKKGLSEKE
jgi:predicted DNA-binding protein (MmcQ/YjbR family)